MSELPADFREARALRDAARAVLTEDLAHLRRSLQEEGVASRVTTSVGSSISGRVKTGARDVLDQAKMQASDHGGILAMLIGAIILWLAREPLLSLFAAADDAPQREGSDTDHTNLVGEDHE